MPYSPLFAEALAYATHLHHSQIRKGTGIPYITHLLGVASLVGEQGGSEAQVIAALLHDSIEDQLEHTPTVREDICRVFGAEILDIVETCTKPEIDSPDYRTRQTPYLDRLRSLADDHPALLVITCDKLYNARSMARDLEEQGAALWSRFNGSREEILWYYDTLLDALEGRCSQYIWKELTRAVAVMRS